MKHLHEFDTRGRLRLDKIINTFLKDGKKIVFFSKDHMTIFEKENYENYINKLAEICGIDKYNFAILINGESIEYATDPQGRFVVPREYRTEKFNEKQVYIVPVEFEGMKTIEIYPKSVYEKNIANLTQFEINIKGKENEEGRRKD